MPVLPNVARGGGATAPVWTSSISRRMKNGICSPVRIPVLALACAALLAAGCTVASSSASSSFARTTRFHSKEYGYSITLPGPKSRWVITPGFEPWTTETTDRGVGWLDSFDDTSTSRFSLIGTHKMPAGAKLSQWMSLFHARQGCAQTSPATPSRLGGAPAREYTFRCFDAHGIVILGLHGKRGYFMLLSVYGVRRAISKGHRREFEVMRRGFRFTRR